MDTYLNAISRANSLIMSFFYVLKYLLRNYQMHLADLEIAKELSNKGKLNVPYFTGPFFRLHEPRRVRLEPELRPLYVLEALPASAQLAVDTLPLLPVV